MRIGIGIGMVLVLALVLVFVLVFVLVSDELQKQCLHASIDRSIDPSPTNNSDPLHRQQQAGSGAKRPFVEVNNRSQSSRKNAEPPLKVHEIPTSHSLHSTD